MVSESHFELHTFATPLREILQLPETKGKKRKDIESSPSDETPWKIMKAETTEEWKKEVLKSRRKASHKQKTGTIPLNPKQNGSKTENNRKQAHA